VKRYSNELIGLNDEPLTNRYDVIFTPVTSMPPNIKKLYGMFAKVDWGLLFIAYYYHGSSRGDTNFDGDNDVKIEKYTKSHLLYKFMRSAKTCSSAKIVIVPQLC